ncbi:unnamed protein product [Heterobilharzia americana]|nr:unnamed protein product [Heterobilharzia americana]
MTVMNFCKINAIQHWNSTSKDMRNVFLKRGEKDSSNTLQSITKSLPSLPAFMVSIQFMRTKSQHRFRRSLNNNFKLSSKSFAVNYKTTYNFHLSQGECVMAWNKTAIIFIKSPHSLALFTTNHVAPKFQEKAHAPTCKYQIS